MSILHVLSKAGRAHRLYVFGVTFSALVLLGFLLTAIVAAELSPSARGIPPAETVDSTALARQSAMSEYRSARAGLARARARLDAEQLALFDFMNDQFMTLAAPREAHSGGAPKTAVNPPMLPSNPQIIELERQIAEAQKRKTSLLDRLTPAHPAVQSLESSIIELQRRLAALRATNPIQPPPMESQGPALETAATVDNRANAAAREKLHGLMISAGRAQQEYEAALEKDRTLWNEYGRTANIVAAPSAVRIEQEPQSARPIMALGVVLLFAMLCGFVASRVARRSPPTFATPADVEATLEIPVLGSLAFAGGAAHSTNVGSVAEPSWLRRSILAGEIVLAVAIGSFVVLALIDAQVFRHMLADPLSGMIEGIVKMRHLAAK